MATKQPLKAAKAASKTSPQAKKAVPAKKSVPAKKQVSLKKAGKVAVKVAPKSPAKSAKPVPGKTAKLVSPVAKKATVQIKHASKNTPAKKVAVKEAAKKPVQQVKKAPITEKAQPTVKAVAAKKQVAVEKEPVAKPAPAPKAAPVSSKPIIVPPKPAINPKPAPAVKSEPVKAGKPTPIPKTSTDKKVTYEPEFTKSVLDAPEQVPSNGPIMRYSDSDLAEFRELINRKLDAAKKELGYLQGLITRKDEMGGDESDNRYMTMEDGSMSMEREQLSQMASRQITFIDHLEKAIMRIENKTYGICRVTGKLIDKARLRAVPHATLSMEAKMGITK
jgi:RNA polymerase-binding transcription factor DksA